LIWNDISRKESSIESNLHTTSRDEWSIESPTRIKTIYYTYRQNPAEFSSEPIRIGSTDWKSEPIQQQRIELDIPKESSAPEAATDRSILPSMETVDEAEEATTATTTSTEELKQLIQHLQQELILEDKRHFDTVSFYKDRIQEVQEEHTKKQCLLESQLLHAITAVDHSVADSDYWLNNTKIPKKEQPKKKLTKEEKTLIRSRVKKAYTASKKK